VKVLGAISTFPVQGTVSTVNNNFLYGASSSYSSLGGGATSYAVDGKANCNTYYMTSSTTNFYWYAYFSTSYFFHRVRVFIMGTIPLGYHIRIGDSSTANANPMCPGGHGMKMLILNVTFWEYISLSLV
jgi:hypothetical protein